MTLFDLQPGDLAKVHSYSSEDSYSRRLREMGLVEGTTLQVVRFAPFGDPVEISYRGFHLSIGRSMAQLVNVQPNETEKT